MTINEAIKNSKAYLCLECGKCTSVCPVSRFNRGYSPRILINRALKGTSPELMKDKNIWTCLTCRLCDEQCPADVNYVELTQAIRFEAQKLGEEAICSHGGAAQSLMRIMSTPSLMPKRMDWVSKDLKIADQGEILYFVGCLPYFDVLFSDIGVETLRQSRATVKILNKLGITPVVLAQERCCGHDLIWQGDFENFKKLAEYNINEIKKSGAKKIIFSCPECYRTFKIDYPKYFEINFEMEHISEFVGREIAGNKIKFNDLEKTVTFQDPCRLGRHLGIYDAPRKVMAAIPKLRLNEMRRSKQRAVCCGVSAWMNCATFSKQIQLMRLKEAKETGADLLIVSCPKCEIHFNCAMREVPSATSSESPKIETVNLVTLIAEQIQE